MDQREFLAGLFEKHRGRLWEAAHRMLGSAPEADRALERARRRVSDARADGGSDDVEGWLTAVVVRVCLDALHRRRAAAADSPPRGTWDAVAPAGQEAPDPGGHARPGEPAGSADGPGPRGRLADAVGAALLVVLDGLDPAERLALVLHDVFGTPYEELAGILDRSPAAARRLADRARRRVRGGVPTPDPDRHREVVEAFLTAAGEGDVRAVRAVLAPDVVARRDADPVHPGRATAVRGAEAVARNAPAFARPARSARAALVNGAPGVVAADGTAGYRVLAFEIEDGRILDIEIITDPVRLGHLTLAPLD
ncbi:sigma factor-like helix-turn-helix DNA-binding protein [Streptomyces sp. NRRL S-87]|uniref:sigma factor-like helix-turn-helix DNA-binding protein n=1 Tax=Streptomyces sp. NRRL S-87 TaxID=1463920 RepID=UPI0004C1A9F4|nr:sigma factor-like helix-turn-helix DNA-binding protein [Streptomyces sp. NRRL S-87]